MTNKGKHEAQSVPEMLEDMADIKERGLATRRGVSLYKAQSGEYSAQKLRELLSKSLDELAVLATKERITLADADAVRTRSVVYLKACERAGVFPSILGLSRALGLSRRALYAWTERHPESETTEWIELFSDLCADILNESALKNNANTIESIFLAKAMYGLRESSELIIKPGSERPEGEYSAEDIADRYILPDDTEGDE